MLEEASSKLGHLKFHGFSSGSLAVVLEGHLHLVVVQLQQAVVGKGNPIGISGLIFKNYARIRKWGLNEYHPLLSSKPSYQR